MTLVYSDGSIAVAIRSSQTAYQINHFQALCRFSSSDTQPLQIVIPQPTDLVKQNDIITQLRPLDELYGQILFHSGRFRRIERYTYLHAKECIADILSSPNDTWFARYLPSQLVLGDAAMRDAIIHSIQACIPQATLLPISVDRIIFIEQPEPATTAQRIRVHAREREQHGDLFIYDVETRDNNERLLEQWQGLHLRLVGTTLPQAQWAEALLGPYFERRIAEFYPQLQIHLTLQVTTLQEISPQETLVPTSLAAISNEETEEIFSPNAQSTALTLTLTNPGQATCNTKAVITQPRAAWRTLLNASQYALAEHMSAESLENFDIAATRILAAIETLKKAEATFDTPLELVATKDDGWQILAMGPYVLMTYMTHVRNQQWPTVFTFCHQSTVDTLVITQLSL
jgi:enediyne polyketide synthase